MPPSRNHIRNDIPAPHTATCPTCRQPFTPIRRQRYCTPAACRGSGFANLRDEAMIRLYANTGARLSEVGNLLLADLDMNTESVGFHGKGAKDRRVRFGAKTARALSRYLRTRAERARSR